jgi:ABC-type nitrate/sulfonate/bicarbonate transport system substrate-binding protein
MSGMTRRQTIIGALALGANGASAQTPRSLRAIYPTRSSSSWAFYIAREAGIYAKHGLDVKLDFGVHPVGLAGLVSGEVHFTNYSVDDTAAAALRDANAFVVYSSILSKASFALMAKPEFATVESLKGKRMGCGRVGDPPYHYTVGLIKKFGLKAGDLQWVPTGTDASARAQMLVAGQLDAALITPPAYYSLEARGLRKITTLMEHPELGIFTGLTMRRSYAVANPDVPEKLLRAHAEAIRLFHADKKSAVEIYRKYDPAPGQAEAERVYDDTVAAKALDRVPVMPKWAAESAADRLSADLPAARTFDYQKIMDMSLVRKLIAEGFYEQLFGEGVKAEQEKALREGFA